MKAVIFINGSGAELIVTSHESLSDPVLVRKLAAKGIEKYIAYEVPMELVEARYGHHFHAVMSDLKQDDDLRVVDFDGHRIFHHFSFADFGQPTYHEPRGTAAT
jgi:hypothetical protein